MASAAGLAAGTGVAAAAAGLVGGGGAEDAEASAVRNPRNWPTRASALGELDVVVVDVAGAAAAGVVAAADTTGSEAVTLAVGVSCA